MQQGIRKTAEHESHGAATGTIKTVNTGVHHADQFIGKTIGNCEIIKRMNEGGTALIYQAHNIRFDLKRVVKILKPAFTEEEEYFIRFRQEAQLVARFDHPNILRVYDTGQVGGFFYIEMEYIEGQTLREYIRSNPKISEREILSIAAQLADALDYAHSVHIQGGGSDDIHGILHRDIKPENIMLTASKTVKLMDFGAAKPLNITSNTMQGMIVGTFHYMSPEQISDAPLDVRSDFFSLGIVMYELATGVRPFSATTLTELIERIRTCKYTRVRQLRKTISPLTEELIDRLLSKTRDHRPSTAKEISESVTHCIHSYDNWGTGKRVFVPFSFKRHFSTVALIASIVALVFSGIALYRSFFIDLTPVNFSESASIPLLEQGRNAERKEMWDDAIGLYKMVPPMEKGGLANEYLEAQVRMAAIMIKYQENYTKARKILEALKSHYSDPVIDAYLGRVYFHLDLFKEAQERFESALKSTAGSVIAQTPDSKSEILYYSACSIDGRFTQDEQNEALLVEAIKAWDFYLEFSKCDMKPKEPACVYAMRRREELSTTMHH
ncbi:MAG: serine/threonine protein kinase [Chitinispirillaceae bacterium]|nr:serine/threonine protein kinase [Chitinispirillaceae bacterium]